MKSTRFNFLLLFFTGVLLSTAVQAGPSTQQAEDEWTKAQSDYSKRLSGMVAPKAADILKLKAEILDPKEKDLQAAYDQELKTNNAPASGSGGNSSTGAQSGFSGAALPPSSSSGPTPAVVLDGSNVKREIQYTARKKKDSDIADTSPAPALADSAAPAQFEPEISYPAKKSSDKTPDRIPTSK